MDIAALLENRKKEKGFTPESFCESVLNEYGYRGTCVGFFDGI